jgi:predicted porin
MKKTLIALAAVAAVGAASAQSSVTFFGLVDLGAGVTKDSNTTAGGVTTSKKRTGMESVINGSRFGFRGVEDLGGGLKADFMAEFRMFADELSSGSFNGSGAFGENRQSWLGLSSDSLGGLRLGRQYTPYHALQGGFDLVNGNTNSLPGNVQAMTSRQRASNAITYNLPKFGGLSASVMYGFGEAIEGVTTTAATNSSNSSTSWNVLYSAGPLAVGAGQDRYKDNQNSTAASVLRYRGLISDAAAFQSLAGQAGATLTATNVAASYDLGVAKVSAQVFSAKDDAASSQKFDGYYLGVNVPVTGQFSVSASMSQADRKVGGVDSGDLKGYQLLAKYDLSKRTTLYAAAGQDKLSAETGSLQQKRQQTAVGVRHTF